MLVGRYLFWLYVTGLLISPGTFAQTREAGTSSSSGLTQPTPVKVETVNKVRIATNSSAYLISFKYDFGKRSPVYIKGLGIVPSKGEYHYISQEQELEFLDPTDNSLLVRVPARETAVVAATPPLNEIPNEHEFPSAFRSFLWDTPASLLERADETLGKYFNYLPHENNRVTYLTTTYTPLTLDKRLIDRGILAQIALLISFPYDPATGHYSFRVQSLVKEGRPLSDDLRPTKSDDILKAAAGFVDRLVVEMKEQRRKKE